MTIRHHGVRRTEAPPIPQATSWPEGIKKPNKTIEAHCETCGRNTTWDEVRSWAATFALSSIRPTPVQVGWRCRVCGRRKAL